MATNNDVSKRSRKSSQSRPNSTNRSNRSDEASPQIHRHTLTLQQFMSTNPLNQAITPVPVVNSSDFPTLEESKNYQIQNTQPIPTSRNMQASAIRRTNQRRDQSIGSQRNNANTGNTAERTHTLSPKEQAVNQMVADWIAKTHTAGKFVDPHELNREVLRHFHVEDKRHLGVTFNNLVPWNNHNSRIKSIDLYMSVFKETVNICTLHDLKRMLADFMGVSDYNELRIGPLQMNPSVVKVFEFQPENQNSPIPEITTGEVITEFVRFFQQRQGKYTNDFEVFLTHLSSEFNLRSWKSIGLFCRSMPYLREVSGKVQRNFNNYLERTRVQDALRILISDAEENLEKIISEISSEQQQSAFLKKKDPVDVFNHLMVLIEKHFQFIPSHSALYAALMLLRGNRLLAALLNLSIFLGSIVDEDELRNQLKTVFMAINSDHADLQKYEQLIDMDSSISRKEKKSIQKIRNEGIAFMKNLQSIKNENGDDTSTISQTDTSNDNHHRRTKPMVSFHSLCRKVAQMLAIENPKLTIKQLHALEQDLCQNHECRTFSELYFDENEQSEISLIDFLHKYQDQIDPDAELIIYDETNSVDNFDEILSFTRQLNIYRGGQNRYKDDDTIHPYAVVDQRKKSGIEKWKMAEKAIAHKFGKSLDSRNGRVMSEKLNSDDGEDTNPLIRYEHSLIHADDINELDLCPHSLNISEKELCKLIKTAPVLIDLYSWLNWNDFFRAKYGNLKHFLHNHTSKLNGVLFLETTKNELVCVPAMADVSSFKELLMKNKVRDAVGHLCSIVIQEGSAKQVPFQMLRVFMDTWFTKLRTVATINGDPTESILCVLEFLDYLPMLIGRSRILTDLILEPMNHIFPADSFVDTNIRSMIWSLADRKQRAKLEFWAYKFEIAEWKNTDKWSGVPEDDGQLKKSIVKQGTSIYIAPHNLSDSPPEINPNPVNSTLNIDEPITPRSNVVVQDESNALAHINRIREQLGVNVDLDSKERSTVSHLQGVLKRSLEKLSTDLYSEDNHFVLELVQNADDNHYDSDLPTIRFKISPKRVIVYNNEVGFQPKNIEAVCNVGASTKGKHTQGYTGHKGIGFKSVFMISHQPEIHSNDYHIRFDTMSGKDHIGYILPIWVNKCEETLEDPTKWTTCIRLPTKQEVQYESLKQKFDNIEGKLLLFLNRLKRIEIVDENSQSVTEKNFVRVDHAGGLIIELQENIGNGETKRNLWLVIKKVFSVPEEIKSKLRDIKGPVDQTTIALAFPLEGLINDNNAKTLTAQPIFAYLPLRSYGFRFILQADFEIPASRQDFRRDNLWNEWLKTRLPRLFHYAYEEFRCLHETLPSLELDGSHNLCLNQIQIMKYFLKFLPNHYEIETYFQSVVTKTLQTLSGQISLPATQVLNGKKQIVWVSPSECIINKDQFIRKILSEELLYKYRNCYYLHEDIIATCDEKLLLDLGCHSLEISDILDLVESLFSSSDQEYPKDDAIIKQVGQWLVCVCYYIYSLKEKATSSTIQKSENDAKNRLSNLKIFPLNTEANLISLKDFKNKTILLPFDKSKGYSKDLRMVIDTIPTIDERLMTYIENEYPIHHASVIKLLNSIGLSQTLNIYRIYTEYILPVMSDPDQWSKKSDELLLAYFIVIFQYIYTSEQGMSKDDLLKLSKTMLIKTQSGKFLSLGDEQTFIHLSRSSGFDVKYSMDRIPLNNEHFHFVSKDYLTKFGDVLQNMGRKANRLTNFFEDLNISDFLQTKLEDNRMYPAIVCFINTSQLDGTKWSNMKAKLEERVYEPFVIRDYRSYAFELLVSTNLTRELCSSLLEYLNLCYNAKKEYYSANIITARSLNSGSLTSILAIPSSLMTAMRETSWIPIENGTFAKPTEAYILDQSQSMLKKYVQHVDIPSGLNNADFTANILGFQRNVSPYYIFQLFMNWSCDINAGTLETMIQSFANQDLIPCSLEKTFVRTHNETLQHMVHIYRFLCNDSYTRQLIQRFRQWPLIFIPTSKEHGQFMLPGRMYWEEIPGITMNQSASNENMYYALKRFYGDVKEIKNFFVGILGVSDQPKLEQYIPLLKETVDDSTRWKVVSTLVELSVEKKHKNFLKEQLKDIPFITLTNTNNQLAKYDDKIFYPDNPEIAKLFRDLAPIIRFSSESIPVEFQLQFISIFNIKKFSSSVEASVKVGEKTEAERITHFYIDSIDLIQCFLLENRLIDDERSKQLAQVFRKMMFYSVESIQVSYEYEGVVKTITESASTHDAYVDELSASFYILKRFENSETRHKYAMVEFLVDDPLKRKDLDGFIDKCLLIYEQNNPNALATKREEFKLDISSESKWIISTKIESTESKETSSTESEQAQQSEEDTEAIIAELLNQERQYPKKDPKQSNTSTLTSIGGGKQYNTSGNVSSTRTNANNTDQEYTTATDSDKLEDNPEKMTDGSGHDSNASISTGRSSHDDGSTSSSELSTSHTQNNGSGKTEINEPSKVNDDTTHQDLTPRIIGNFIRLPENDIETILLSDFTNLDTSAFDTDASNTIRLPMANSDSQTGRYGEELVFHVLKTRYPELKIIWINQEEESFKPYDIVIQHNAETFEYIEVKTTKNPQEHSFFISAYEMDLFSKYQNNSYIYRVFLAEPIKESKIIKISNIVDRLRNKTLKLVMSMHTKTSTAY